MEAIEETSFDVYIDFVKGQGGASRVFHSMALLVDAFAQLDEVLVGIVSDGLRADLVLEDVSGGSIRSRLRSVLQDIPDDALKDGDWKKVLGHFLVRAKYIVCEWLQENAQVVAPSQVQALQDRLTIEAELTSARHLPIYRPANTSTLLGAIAEIDRAMEPLDPRDVVKYEIRDGSVSLPRTQHVHDELIRELLTREIISAVDERIVKVKKPDFLGRSQWVLNYAGHSISATMDDSEWLRSFQAGRVEVKPGDSLRVLMREEVYYGHNMEVVHVARTVIMVVEVIRPEPPLQATFGFA